MHRKISASFRDNFLFVIFEQTIANLNLQTENLKKKKMKTSLSGKEDQIMDQLLQSLINCLSFDFIGTMGGSIENEDGLVLQIPSAWKVSITGNILDLLFELYSIFIDSSRSVQVLFSCFQICSNNLFILIFTRLWSAFRCSHQLDHLFSHLEKCE